MTKPRDSSRRTNGAGNGHESAADPDADTTAAVREFLERRGCPSDVVLGGLEALVTQWEGVADALDRGYPLDTLDDYLNDMDARQLIADTIGAVPRAGARLRVRLETADRRVRAQVAPHARCLWGDRIAASHGWSASREWWYFSRPQKPGPGLKRDLGD